jgi:asparagine synthase (glutamine-hydrolysing)
LRDDLRELSWSLLTDGTARGRGLFRPEAVRAMLRRHADGVDESRHLWSLLQFELWHRRFLDHVPDRMRDPAESQPASRP